MSGVLFSLRQLEERNGVQKWALYQNEEEALPRLESTILIMP
jgi:hypothetical protein